MESSHKGGLVKPSEWILIVFAAVLLTAAVSNQRAANRLIPAEAKIDIPADEPSPATVETSADVAVEIEVAAEIEATAETEAAVAVETEIVAVMARPLTEPAADPTN